MIRSWILFQVLIAAASGFPASRVETLGAGDDASARSSTPEFGTKIQIVRVDVGVVDARGRPVDDLKVDDFIVEEDDVPQKIESFQSITSSLNAPGEPWSGNRVSSNTGSPIHAGWIAVHVQRGARRCR